MPATPLGVPRGHPVVRKSEGGGVRPCRLELPDPRLLRSAPPRCSSLGGGRARLEVAYLL